MSKEAMKRALEALVHAYHEDEAHPQTSEAITALQEALEEQPTQRTWVGLTRKEAHDLYDSDYAVFHQRIEAKLKEKNCGV